MNEQDKQWIDNADYETLLHRWRFAPAGDKIFSGEIGVYYEQIMKEKREQVDAAAASKRVGWEQ